MDWIKWLMIVPVAFSVLVVALGALGAARWATGDDGAVSSALLFRFDPHGGVIARVVPRLAAAQWATTW